MLKRIPWVALTLSVAVVLSSAFAVAPIRDAVTLGDVVEASLERPMGYVVLAPASNVLDMLTLLSKRQHVAMLAGVLLLVAAWRVVQGFRGATALSHLKAAGILLAVIVVTYAALAVVPRPMARLIAANADILRIDFHSHTSASHDGRPGWSAERNRAWHRDGGYDVAYITDHAAVSAAERGMARNPNPAADGVTLLQGIEVTWNGEHVAIPGAQRAYRGILTPNLRDVDVDGLRLASLVATREPVVIWNHPHQLGRLPFASGPGTSGVRAIEISNGAPDSMDEVRAERAAIVATATQHDVPVVSGSDNHGWGNTAPNWTLMLIPGWRALAGDALAAQIEGSLRSDGFGATRVIERRAAEGTSRVELGVTLLAAPARLLTTLSTEERVAWLVWIWAITIGTWLVRRRDSR